jgi:hypothetical protein
MKALLDLQDVLAMIREQLEVHLTQKNLAREWGISAPYLGDVLRMKREPGEKLLRNLKLKKRVLYVAQDYLRGRQRGKRA